MSRQEKYRGGMLKSRLFLQGEVPYGTKYNDIRKELSVLNYSEKMALVLMVICDRRDGWFSEGQAGANPIWAGEIRSLAQELSLTDEKINSNDWKVDDSEIYSYYRQLDRLGLVGALESGGLRRMDIYCTLSACVSAVLGGAVKPQVLQGSVATARGGGRVDWDYVLTPGAKWVFLS